MDQTKITIKIHAPMLVAFERDLDQLCLKRDAFLNHAIRLEIASLAEELKGKRQSTKARRHVAGCLKRMGTRTLNVVVDKDVAAALNQVIDSTNTVRDAFMNRLVMFLRSSTKLLEYLELPSMVVRSNFQSSYEEMPTSPLKAMDSVFSDPFYYLRLAAEERFETGLYLLPLPDQYTGFTCYLPDHQVPGTPENKAFKAEIEQSLAELTLFEGEAFAAHATPQKREGE